MSFDACENVVDDIENSHSWTIGASLGAGNQPFNESGIKLLKGSISVPGLDSGGLQFTNFCTVTTNYYAFNADSASASSGDENATAAVVKITDFVHDINGNATTRVIVSDCYRYDEFNISSAPTTVVVHSPSIFIYIERRPNSLTENPDCGGKDRVKYIAGPLANYCGQFPGDAVCKGVKGKVVSAPETTSSPGGSSVATSGTKYSQWVAVAGVCLGLVASTLTL